MFPTLPAVLSWPWYTYVAFGVVVLFILGFWLALMAGVMRGCVCVLSGAWRGLTSLGQWLFGLPLVSAGSAHFASRREMAQAGLLRGTGLPLAAYGQEDVLREPHGDHIVVVGPRKSWKSTGIVIPAIEQFTGSVVVNDLRGDLFAATHPARERLGPTYRFAPTQGGSCAMNILDLVRWGQDEQFGDVDRIVVHLLSPPVRQAVPNPFADAARPVLTAIVMHCHALGTGSFPGVVQWMLANRPLKEKVGELLSSSNPLVSSGARRLADMSERLRASVWNAALVPLAIFEDTTIAQHTTHSDVSFTELLHGMQPVSLYLCPQLPDIRRLAGFLGAFVEALVAVLGSPAQSVRHQVLLALDEMGNLGFLPELEQAISFVRGTQILAVFQNIAQVHQTYGADTPLLGSFSTGLYYRPFPNDYATAEHIAGLLGQATVLKRSDSAQVGLLGSWASTRTESEAARALLTVDEILRLPQTAALVLQAGCAPVLARKQGVPAPTKGERARAFAVMHRQGCAVAAGVLLVGAALLPALSPIWSAPPGSAVVQASMGERLNDALMPETLVPRDLQKQWKSGTPVAAAPEQATRRQGPEGPWQLWVREQGGSLGTPKPWTHRSFPDEASCQRDLATSYDALLDTVEQDARDYPARGKVEVIREAHRRGWITTPPRGGTIIKEYWCSETPARGPGQAPATPPAQPAATLQGWSLWGEQPNWITQAPFRARLAQGITQAECRDAMGKKAEERALQWPLAKPRREQTPDSVTLHVPSMGGMPAARHRFWCIEGS